MGWRRGDVRTGGAGAGRLGVKLGARGLRSGSWADALGGLGLEGVWEFVVEELALVPANAIGGSCGADSTVGSESCGGDALAFFVVGSLLAVCALVVMVVRDVMVLVEREDQDERERERVNVNDEPEEPDSESDARAVEAVSEEREERTSDVELFRSLSFDMPAFRLPFLRSFFLPFGFDLGATTEEVAVSSDARSSKSDGPSGSLSLLSVTIGAEGKRVTGPGAGEGEGEGDIGREVDAKEV